MTTFPATAAPVPLARRLADVRGSVIRDLLTLTARDDVLSLAGGLPAADQLPRQRIAVAAERALRAPGSVQYGETAGLAALRDVVADHESGRLGRPAARGEVVITSGSQQALDLLARAVLDPGDPVVVETPATSGRCRCSRPPARRCIPSRSMPTAWTSRGSPRCSPAASGRSSCIP